MASLASSTAILQFNNPIPYTNYVGGCSSGNITSVGELHSIQVLPDGLFCISGMDDTGSRGHTKFDMLCGEQGTDSIYFVCSDDTCSECTEPLVTVSMAWEQWFGVEDRTNHCYEESYTIPETNELVQTQVTFTGADEDDVLAYTDFLYYNSCASNIETQAPSIDDEEQDDTPPEDDEDDDEACSTFLELVCGSEVHTTLCELLINDLLNSHAKDVLEDPDGPEGTLFAPVDDAFVEIGAELSGLAPEFIDEILLFHFASGSIASEDLICKETIPMFSGGDSRTKCITDDETGVTSKYQKGGSNKENNILPKILVADIEACNGVLHVVDGVLLPGFYTDVVHE